MKPFKSVFFSLIVLAMFVIFISSYTPVSAQSLPTIPTLVKPISQMTVPELQAKIQEIAATIQQLQVLLNQLTGTTVSNLSQIPLSFNFQSNLKQGQCVQGVKYLQIFLNSNPNTIVSLTGPGFSGKETICFGPKTKQALIKYQEKYKQQILAPYNLTKGTGKLGPLTRAKINQELSQRTGGEIVTPPPIPVCGDNSCNGSETCTTCPGDCGICPIVCGNSIKETGETCDNTDLGDYETGQGKCIQYSSSYESGNLSCSQDCKTIITSGCVPITPPPPTLSVNLTVSSTSSNWQESISGQAPLTGVDLKADVSGTATGNINYSFDCQNDGIWDSPDTTQYKGIASTTKEFTNGCSYSSPGTYTARVKVERNIAPPAYDTVTIIVTSLTPVCGDNICNGTETCSTCSGDCGTCPTGNVYYVDAVNGNDANLGTSGQPWKTLPRAMTSWTGAGVKVANGDTIKMRDGNYGAFSEMNVIHTNWITYEADTGHLPVFTSISINRYPSHSTGYLRFNGITVEAPAADLSGIGVVRSDYVEFLNMKIIGRGYTKGYYPFSQNAAIGLRESENIIIDNCQIDGADDSNGFAGYTSVSGMDGSLFGKAFAVGIDVAEGYAQRNVRVTNCNISSCDVGIIVSDSNWIIDNNEISYMTTDGIDIAQCNTVGSGKEDPIIISNNHIHHLGHFLENNISAHNDLIQGQYVEINHIIVRNNIMHDSDQQGIFWRPDPTSNSHDWTFENNLLYRVNLQLSNNYAIRIYGGTDIVFRNNTVGRDQRALTGASATGGMFLSENESGKARWTSFSGNIIPQISLYTDAPYGTIFDYENYNIFRKIWIYMTSHTLGNHTLVLSSDTAYKALFKDHDAGDFSLVANSPAINFGNPDYAPATDILGNLRDSQPDAGAYEFQGVAPTCSGTDTSCGAYPSCQNCNSLDGCSGATYRDYYCSGTSCVYTNSSNDPRCFVCTPNQTQSCSTGLQGVCSSGTQTCQSNGIWGSCVQNNQLTTEICNDSLDNECDGKTDCNDPDCSSSSACQSSIPTDYISYWKFDGNVNDEKGINNGIIYGNPQYVSGVQGQALSFNGNGDYIKVTPGTFNNVYGTVVSWMYIRSFAANDGFFTSTSQVPLIFATATNFRVYIQSNSGLVYDFQAGPIPINQWLHLALTWNDTEAAIYFNGARNAVDTIPAHTLDRTTTTFYIASDRTIANREPNMMTDDVMIYNRALSADEIQNIYNAQKSIVSNPFLNNLASVLSAIQEAIKRLQSAVNF